MTGGLLRTLSRHFQRRRQSNSVRSTAGGGSEQSAQPPAKSRGENEAVGDKPSTLARGKMPLSFKPTSAPPRFDLKTHCLCKVLLLDATHIDIATPRKALGQEIYDRVFEHLDLEERDYFGLQFTDHYQVQHWLDPLKPIRKQLTIGPPFTLRFQVKFYSSEPCELRTEAARYLFFLQLKNNVQLGELECPEAVAVELAGLALQSEFGDHNPKEHTPLFISEFRFHPHQEEEMEVAILNYHNSAACRGASPAEAELRYLEKVKWLDMYGVDRHKVEGRDGNEYTLGLTPSGLIVFDYDQKIGLFFWNKVQRLDFVSKKLTLVVEEDADQSESGDILLHTFVFDLSSHKACKHLWKCAVEHHAFFRLKYNQPAKQQRVQLFRLGSTFKYRGRTEFEAVHTQANQQPTRSSAIQRRPSQRYTPRTSHLERQKLRQAAMEAAVGSSQQPLLKSASSAAALPDSIPTAAKGHSTSFSAALTPPTAGSNGHSANNPCSSSSIASNIPVKRKAPTRSTTVSEAPPPPSPQHITRIQINKSQQPIDANEKSTRIPKYVPPPSSSSSAVSD